MTHDAFGVGPAPTLTINNGSFHRGGPDQSPSPHRIIAGAVHYFRVHPAYWQDRLQRLRALGFNTVETYVAWNFHQVRREQPSFDSWQGIEGWADLEAFIRLAGGMGFDVIVRPGPYICSEWDNGGLPTFVTDTPRLRPRCADPKYLALVDEWFDELIPRLAPLQASQGGPIVAFQAENEYGSFGDDATYMAWCVEALRARGITELIYTADGPTVWMLDGGSSDDPGVPATATFGSRVADASDLLAARRPGEPFMCAEFWNGWFDHWGEPHHVRNPQEVAGYVKEILDARSGTGSISIYMAHGGTNFSLTSGANHDGTNFQPTITSYDSDAPVAEDGCVTEKGRALRDVFTEALGIDTASLPPIPDLPQRQRAQTLAVQPGGSWLDAFAAHCGATASAYPMTFADFQLPNGLLLLQATPKLTASELQLTLRGLHDRAYVWLNDRFLGVFDEKSGNQGIAVSSPAASTTAGHPTQLQILVENQGRINYGPRFAEPKGILDGVFLGQRMVHGWQCTPIALDEIEPEALASLMLQVPMPQQDSRESAEDSHRGATALASFEADVIDPVTGLPGDTFVELEGFTRGYLFINGFLLGRYSNMGPQVTYFVPGPMLRPGLNVITVLELEQPGSALHLRAVPNLGPTDVHVEEF